MKLYDLFDSELVIEHGVFLEDKPNEIGYYNRDGKFEAIKISSESDTERFEIQERMFENEGVIANDRKMPLAVFYEECILNTMNKLEGYDSGYYQLAYSNSAMFWILDDDDKVFKTTLPFSDTEIELSPIGASLWAANHVSSQLSFLMNELGLQKSLSVFCNTYDATYRLINLLPPAEFRSVRQLLD